MGYLSNEKEKFYGAMKYSRLETVDYIKSHYSGQIGVMINFKEISSSDQINSLIKESTNQIDLKLFEKVFSCDLNL